MENKTRTDNTSDAQEKAIREERRKTEKEKRLKRDKKWMTIKMRVLKLKDILMFLVMNVAINCGDMVTDGLTAWALCKNNLNICTFF